MECFKTDKCGRYSRLRSEREAQEMCRNIDEKVNFINARVKPYKKEISNPRKKNISGNVPKASQQYT